MRWDLNLVRNIENTDIIALSDKELHQLDRFLTDTVSKRLEHTKPLGLSPAEQILKQSGVITDGMRANSDSMDRATTIARIVRLKHFVSLKTSTKKGYENYIRNKERITRDRGIKPSVLDVINELKRRGLYGQLIERVASGMDTQSIVELIESIIEEEDGPISVDEVIEKLMDDSDHFNQLPEDDFGFFGKEFEWNEFN